MQQVESSRVHGVVKSFHQNPKGDVDGLVLEDGSEVRFPPHHGKKVASLVSPGDEVMCSVHPHVDPKGHAQQHAKTIVTKSGQTLDLDGPPPHDKAPHGPPPHDKAPHGPPPPHDDKAPHGPPPHDKAPPPPDHVPHHEQMLAEIHAIRAALGGEDEPTSPGKPHGPPHERVLHELRGLRALVERRAGARTP